MKLHIRQYRELRRYRPVTYKITYPPVTRGLTLHYRFKEGVKG